MKYINTENLKVLLFELKENHKCHNGDFHDGVVFAVDEIEEGIDSLQHEQPEPYFYCKHGGIMPLCSDCKRNHINSSFKAEEITTWYLPSAGTKRCMDYIQQEQPSIPTNIDEMAEEYYDEMWDELGGITMVRNNEHDIWYPSSVIETVFKAGAQRIIEQLKQK